jgi:hypothetical protein
MKPSDFFIEQEDPDWGISGGDPEDRWITVFDAERVEQLRRQPDSMADDIETAYALAQLAHDELLAYGTAGGERLSDEELAVVLRSLRAVLNRRGISFDPPFRDFKGFHGYWSKHDMGGTGGWAARRGYLNDLFTPIHSQLDQLEDERGTNANVRGVDGQIKNLIFASNGPKPEIVLRDAINNVIEVTRNAEYCLFYDQPLDEGGLTWGQLVAWWRTTAGLADESVARALYSRLSASVRDNPAEYLVFRTYCERYGRADAVELPALLPQIYLHFDPLTLRQRHGRASVLERERMDFLLLLPGSVRVVVEVDGKQHYAEGDTASPQRYSEMMAEDRRLRLRGYEVFRFGGFELAQPGASAMLRSFFDDLLSRHSSMPSTSV